MRRVYIQELEKLLILFQYFETLVPAPITQVINGNARLRYQEKSIGQALIQKFARQLSGLHAIDHLLSAGLLQEQAVIQRVVDEIMEDIIFLSIGKTVGPWTNNHDRYLTEFWLEEFDTVDPLNSTQKRGMVSRDKIRAYISRAGKLPDPSTVDNVGRTIHKTYSGFVHVASPQVMDMCLGSPPTFHVCGMLGTFRMLESAESAFQYVYRGMLSAFWIANILDAGSVVTYCRNWIDLFGKQHPEIFMARGTPFGPK